MMAPPLGALPASEDDDLMTARRYIPGIPYYHDEEAFLAAVLQLARACGWLAYHTRDSRRSAPGFPDLLLAKPSQRRVVALELKLPGRKPTPWQDGWIAAFAAAGITARVVYPADIAWIEDLLTGKEPVRNG